MKLIYITGPPGIGKTTIQKELSALGYAAYDIDDSRFGGPINLQTGEKVVIPSASERPDGWFNAHEWRVSVDAVQTLKDSDTETKNDFAFLCGTASTDHLVWHLFDKVVLLNTDEDTLVKRVNSRTDNDYGHNQVEMDEILCRRRGMRERLGPTRATIIDASMPAIKIIREILDVVSSEVN